MKNTKYIFAFLAIVLFAAGPAASAATTTQLGACADVTGFSRRIITNISERSLALRKVRMERLEQISKRWMEQDAEKIIAREAAGRIKEADFGALDKMLANGTEEQKKALAVFKSSLEAATKERRLAIDAANDNFRKSVKDMLENRSESFHAAAGEFAGSVKNSLDATALECATGLPPTNIQAGLAARLRAARQKFEGDPRANVSGLLNMRTLAAQYKADVAAATAEFKAKVAAARDAFKAAVDD